MGKIFRFFCRIFGKKRKSDVDESYCNFQLEYPPDFLMSAASEEEINFDFWLLTKFHRERRMKLFQQLYSLRYVFSSDPPPPPTQLLNE